MNSVLRLSIATVFAFLFAGCVNQNAVSTLNVVSSNINFNDTVQQLEKELDRKKAILRSVKKMNSGANIVIVYDASGSMQSDKKEYTTKSGQKRYKESYQALVRMADLFDTKDNVSLLVFGNRYDDGTFFNKHGNLEITDMEKAIKSHKDIYTLYQSNKGFDKDKFLTAIKNAKLDLEEGYKGDTPIGNALDEAKKIVTGKTNTKVILITDGLDSGEQFKKQVSNKNKVSFIKNPSDVINSLENFTPILNANPTLTIGSNKVFDYYDNLAKISGSRALNADSALELVSQYIDAEMQSVKYSIKSTDLMSNLQAVVNQKDNKQPEGRIGVPMKLQPGKYTMTLKITPQISRDITVKEQGETIYVLNIDSNGALKIDSLN